MTNQTALTVIQPRPLTPQVWQMIEAIAPTIHSGRLLLGQGNADTAASIMLKGYELGLPLTAAFDLIHVIQGKPGLSPRGALAILHDSPVKAELKITRLTDDKGKFVGYEAYGKRTNGFEFTARFTMEDAARAGLVKKDSGWEKYPENMCLWRAIGFMSDVVFPDVLSGMKFADQLGAELTPDGDVIEGSWSAPEAKLTPEMAAESNIDVEPPEWQSTLQRLLDEYGPEAVLQANEGKIPATEDEVHAVQKVLAVEAIEQLNGELFGEPA